MFLNIILICVLIYCIYKSINNNIKEKMTDNHIYNQVKNYLFNSDNFIKMINNSAKEVKERGLRINGNLIVKGSITVRDDISNNNFSLSKINDEIKNENKYDPKKEEEERLKIEESRCDKNPQSLLGNKTCNHWSWMDERWQQRFSMPNYHITGTVLPAHDCWYAPTSQCVSRECLKSPNPAASCPKRKW